ncbi:hypothetical protein J2S45_001620 [Trueperella abortisuis]|uniref:Uncharacterized protein n=2 Tax=Trueperella abortisuis TaxID=445930 RepID=A0ABT9PJP1_9ACTO|nr:hypothetical protein [Trueperella abortisuis]
MAMTTARPEAAMSPRASRTMADVSKRPSRESFVQNFFAEDGAGREWFPIDLQPYLENEGGHEDVLEACPALPPSDTLYGVPLK